MSCDNVAGKLLNLGRVFYRIPGQLCKRFTVFYRNDLQKKDFERESMSQFCQFFCQKICRFAFYRINLRIYDEQ